MKILKKCFLFTIISLLIFPYTYAEQLYYNSTKDNLFHDKEIMSLTKSERRVIRNAAKNNSINNKIKIDRHNFIIGQSTMKSDEDIKIINGSFEHKLSGPGRENDKIYYTIVIENDDIEMAMSLDRRGFSYTLNKGIVWIGSTIGSLAGAAATEHYMTTAITQGQGEGGKINIFQKNLVSHAHKLAGTIAGGVLGGVVGAISKPVINIIGRPLGKKIDGDWTQSASILTKTIATSYL